MIQTIIQFDNMDANVKNALFNPFPPCKIHGPVDHVAFLVY